MKNRTVLYRLFTAEGTLLYIGVSARVEFRICCEHQVDKHWFSTVERATFEHFESRWHAEEAEMLAIRREAPLFNVAHNEMPWGGKEHAWEILQERIERKKELEEVDDDVAAEIESMQIPGQLEWYEGELRHVLNPARHGWWRYNERSDPDKSDSLPTPHRNSA